MKKIRFFFSYSQFAISVRVTEKLPIERCRYVRSLKNDPQQWKYICIEGKIQFLKSNFYIVLVCIKKKKYIFFRTL